MVKIGLCAALSLLVGCQLYGYRDRDDDVHHYKNPPPTSDCPCCANSTSCNQCTTACDKCGCTPTAPTGPTGPTAPTSTTESKLCSTCTGPNQCGTGGECLVFSSNEEEGFCGRSCLKDGDCPGGFECRAAGTSRQCVPTDKTCDGKVIVPQCEDSTDCANGQVCSEGSCIAKPPQACTFSSQCTDGTCVDGFCRAACDGNADCSDGEVCDRGLCSAWPLPECRSSSDCGSAYACVDGRCLAGCDTTADCIENEVCTATSTCERYTQTMCTDDDACRPEERCSADNACSLICQDATDCPQHWACDDRSKLCERNLEIAYCTNDDQCPTGKTCQDNRCEFNP